VQDRHFQALPLHVQVREPMRLGPQSAEQSASAPDAQLASVAGQPSRHVFEPPVTGESEQVAPATTQVSLAQQIWLGPPHAMQAPLSQTVAVAVHLLPAQHS
jgi:hypothetical protein